MSVVDLYRLYQFEYYKEYSDYTVKEFADLMATGLVERKVLPQAIQQVVNDG